MVAPAKTRSVTAEELLKLSSQGRFELVKGELIQMSPPGFEHGKIGMELAWRLAAHVHANRLGVVTAAETGFRLARDPDTVRAPDVAFISKERVPAQPPKGYLDLAPDLIAEVVSPNDDPDEVQSKVAQWLGAGVRVALVIYPGSRQVAVYHSLKQVVVLTEGDTLELPDLLPGLACPVSELFA
jgi:Uma2 family endonuclease